MKTYHLQKTPDWRGYYNYKPVKQEGREYIAEEVNLANSIIKSVEADSWIEAKHKFGFALTPLQELLVPGLLKRAA